MADLSVSIFDESIFVDGSILNGFENIGYSNRADKFLIEKYTTSTMAICGTSISINPQSSCNKINIYTMNSKNKENNVRFYSFNQINVVNDIGEEIYIGELKTAAKPFHTNAELTSFEAAIMIKYFAMQVPISITQELYLKIHKHFQDGRSWFNTNRNEKNSIQHKSNEIGVGNIIINIPTITFNSTPINT